MSAVIWWSGMRAWAASRFGHLDVDALGSTPILWTALILAASLLLLTRTLPR